VFNVNCDNVGNGTSYLGHYPGDNYVTTPQLTDTTGVPLKAGEANGKALIRFSPEPTKLWHQ